MAEQDSNTQQDGNGQEDGPQEGTRERTGTNPENTGSSAGESEAAFTQADVDRIVQQRLDRERRAHEQAIAEKYGDYDELKTRSDKLSELEEAQLSEAEKAERRMTELEERLAEIQSQNARLELERTEALVKAAVVAKATAMRFVDPEDAYRMLDLSQIETGEDGAIKGIEDQLEALCENKPYLLQSKQGSSMNPTNPGKGRERGETDAERRARLFGGGDTPIGHAGGGGVFMP